MVAPDDLGEGEASQGRRFSRTQGLGENPTESGEKTKKSSRHRGGGAGRGKAAVRNRPWFISGLAIEQVIGLTKRRPFQSCCSKSHGKKNQWKMEILA